MMTEKRVGGRERRRRRVRAKISGTKDRPRLSVFRSNRLTYAQLIDDSAGETLFQASGREVKDKKLNKTQRAGQIGELLATRALKAGIEAVVFDRGGYRYHGRVKALAEGARSKGLKF